MVITWIIFLLAAMVHVRDTANPKRAKRTKRAGKDSDTDSETESIDWDNIEVEASVPTVSKGKGLAEAPKTKPPPTAAEKGKAPMEPTGKRMKTVARKRSGAQGISINEPIASHPPPQEFVSSTRIKDFEKRECIGERHVNVQQMKNRSAEFGVLFDQVGLAPICNFPEKTGYCPHSVRIFYQNAASLIDDIGGRREFHTLVKGIKIKVTPQLIGEVLSMNAISNGLHYLKTQVFTENSWRIVVNGICLLDTMSAGNSVFSKELRKEYKYINFIVCYNILPNMNTKVLRWDRMLFLYLLGNPTAAMGANLNIPYLIWARMTRYIEHSHPTERLPYPMIIMRILKKFKVDTSASSYMYSLGTINETTIVKSLSTKQDDPPSPPLRQRARQQAATSTALAPPSQQAPPSTSDDDASVTSIFKEQQRLSNEQERMSAEFTEMRGDIHVMKTELEVLTASQNTLNKSVSSVKKLVKMLFAKMGCTTSDDSDSQE